MHKWFSTEVGTRRSQSAPIARLCKAAVGVFLLLDICAPISASATLAGCQALQVKYPDLKASNWSKLAPVMYTTGICSLSHDRAVQRPSP
jgi:hypothetical protein